MIKTITSRQHPFVKSCKQLLSGKGRREQGKFLAEGARIAEEAVRTGAAEVLLIRDGESIPSVSVPVYILSEACFNDVSDTKTPQGIIAVCRIPQDTRLTADKLLLCDGIADPGNLGTMIRTAEGAGFGGVLLLGGVDPFHPKTVRSTMGSIFRIPVCRVTEEELRRDYSAYEMVITSLQDSENFYETSFSDCMILTVGSEAHGVSEEIRRLADKRVRLPMDGEVESLNAAVSAGIMMYEIRRRR